MNKHFIKLAYVLGYKQAQAYGWADDIHRNLASAAAATDVVAPTVLRALPQGRIPAAMYSMGRTMNKAGDKINDWVLNNPASKWVADKYNQAFPQKFKGHGGRSGGGGAKGSWDPALPDYRPTPRPVAQTDKELQFAGDLVSGLSGAKTNQDVYNSLAGAAASYATGRNISIPNEVGQQPRQRVQPRYDSSQAQQAQQLQYGKDTLRGMMQFNEHGGPKFSPNQGMRDIAKRYKSDPHYAQMLRNAHKSMYGKDDAYTAWYDNWKAQKRMQMQGQNPQRPTGPVQSQPQHRFVIDYRDRPENQGGIIRRQLPSVKRRVANPRLVEVGNDRASDLAVW